MVAVKRARVLMCLGVGQQQKSAASMGRSLWKPTEKKVIVLAGPTGVGKTAVSLELAKRLGRKAEIISADSVQIYQGLDIGSRKLSVKGREGIPHHLLDVLSPKAQYTAGDFYREAREKTREILARGNTPIVVGGTGFWLRWFVQGRPNTPKSKTETRKEAKRRVEQVVKESQARLAGTGLHKEEDVEELQWKKAVALLDEAGDPETAARLNKNDYFRLERALEIVLSTGRPLKTHLRSHQNKKEEEDEEEEEEKGEGQLLRNLDYKCFFLYPKSRMSLYRRLDLSCEEMVLGGLLQETVHLLNMGLCPGEGTATNAVGYRQFMQYLRLCRDNRMKRGEAWMPTFDEFRLTVSDFQKHTRRLAQDQLTWFRTESAFKWVELNSEEEVPHIARSIHNDSFDPHEEEEEEEERKTSEPFCFDNRAMGYLNKEEAKRLKGYPGVLEKLSGDDRDSVQEQERLLQWVKATIEENVSSQSTWAS